MADQLAQRRQRQRRVLVHDQIDERVHARIRGGRIGHARIAFACCVDACAAVAPRDPQQAAVVHAVEQLGARVRRATEPVAHLAMREMRVHLARVHGAALGDEGEHRMGLLPARGAPRGARRARMHQGMVRARQKAVVDEKVFFDRQPRIAPLEVTGTVVAHAVAQRQVLGARRRSDRVGLHEAELVDRARQRGWREQRAGHRVAAQVVERERCHPGMMPKRKQGPRGALVVRSAARCQAALRRRAIQAVKPRPASISA
jgi:hypothetical protein